MLWQMSMDSTLLVMVMVMVMVMMMMAVNIRLGDMKARLIVSKLGTL